MSLYCVPFNYMRTYVRTYVPPSLYKNLKSSTTCCCSSPHHIHMLLHFFAAYGRSDEGNEMGLLAEKYKFGIPAEVSTCVREYTCVYIRTGLRYKLLSHVIFTQLNT